MRPEVLVHEVTVRQLRRQWVASCPCGWLAFGSPTDEIPVRAQAALHDDLHRERP